ncbi:MAG: DNA polymerase III subunit delta [Acidobacteriota bacterium]
MKVDKVILKNLDALEKDIRSATDRTFYLIMGSDRYQCGLAVNCIKTASLSPEGMAFDSSTFSAKETSSEKIFETASTFPMVSKRRIVIVTEFEKLAEREHEKFLGSLDLLPKKSLMVLVAEELDRRKKLYKTIRDKGCIVEFPQLKGAALRHWVEMFARKRGYNITSSTAGEISDLAGSDLQALTGEMEKLFLFAGKEKEISDEAVDKLVRNSRQHGIFELIDAVARGTGPPLLYRWRISWQWENIRLKS